MKGRLSASNSVTFDIGVEKFLYGISQALWSKLFWVKAAEKILVLRNNSQFSSVLFIHSVVSDSLQPHGLQHARPPCPSPTPEVYSNSCPLSQWWHPAISSSVVPFSSCPQSFPASGSFQMSQFFASGSQSVGVSSSTSVLPMTIQDWFPLGWTGWISLQSKVGKSKWKLWNILTLSSPVTLRIRVLCVEDRRHRCNIEEFCSSWGR